MVMEESTTCDEASIAIVSSAVQDGMGARPVRVECSYGRGFAGLQMIGNVSQVVDDGKERARAALERLGLFLSARKMLLSISPADVKAEGSHLDLAMAVAMAVMLRETPVVKDPARWIFAAEVGLGGELRPVSGVVCHGVAAMGEGLDGVIVAADNLPEIQALDAVSAQSGQRIKYFAFGHLSEVLDWLWGHIAPVTMSTIPAVPAGRKLVSTGPNFDDMDLAPDLRLAAMVAAVGMHSMLLKGAPGCGKSMMAARMPALLPDLFPDEHLLALQIHSCHPERVERSLLAGRPPYRAPHHFATTAAMLGSDDRPGEVALSSFGVLFLDEFPEFRRDVIESLREPLEMGEVRVSRAKFKRVWSAKTLLIAAANNCPCGWFGSKRRRCDCGQTKLVAYRNRLSGPILDRIDLHINMPDRDSPVGAILATSSKSGVSRTEGMRAAVQIARAKAAERNRRFDCLLNRDLPPQALPDALCIGASHLEELVRKMIPAHVSARALVRCLRVARSIADIGDAEKVTSAHIEQAWHWQAFESARERGDVSG